MKPEPEIVAKISTALMASALGAQQIMPEQPISLEETLLALLGGLFGGVLLIRTADPTKAMSALDKAYTVLFSGIIGAMVGPGAANWGAARFGWIHEGLFENLAGGFAAGAVVPVAFGFVVAALRAGQRDPKGALDYATKLGKALRGRE